jgi:hypothetical protein
MLSADIEELKLKGFNFTHVDETLDKILKENLSDEDFLDDLDESEKKIKRLEFINNHLILLIKLSNVKVNNEKLISKFSIEIVSFFLFKYLDEAHYGRPYVYHTDVELIKDIYRFVGYKSKLKIGSKKAAFSKAMDELIILKIIERKSEAADLVKFPEEVRNYRLRSFLELGAIYFD